MNPRPEHSRRSTTKTLSTLVLGAALSLAFLIGLTSSASAAGFGQIGEAFGSRGTGPGQFNEPNKCALFGADPVSGDVFAGDLTGTAATCRIQKFSPTGALEGSVTLPPPQAGTLAYAGIAVDHARGRFYVIRSVVERIKGLGARPRADQVLAFEIEPNGAGELVTASSGPSTIALPGVGSSEALINPQGLAVDPRNGDLVIAAENKVEQDIFARYAFDGTPGPRFEDTQNQLWPQPAGSRAGEVVVGPDGTVYTLGIGAQEGTVTDTHPGRTTAYELPPNLSKVSVVPGVIAAARSEDWPHTVFLNVPAPEVNGPQIALSPDGKILYWKEVGANSLPNEPGVVFVRAFSLASGRTKVVYGGGAYKSGKGSCAIATAESPIAAAAGERVVVFDHAYPPAEEEEEGPIEEREAYGPPRVVTFGPNGTGCPIAAADLKVDGSGEEAVTVHQGDLVSFDASESVLLGAKPTKVVWDFGDGTTKTALPEEDHGASLETTHQFGGGGPFTVKVTIFIGNPSTELSAERTVAIEAGLPFAYFTVSNANPVTGQSVVLDASSSFNPSGGECGTAGCGASFLLGRYAWNFGDGTRAETAEPTIGHVFTNPGGTALKRSITLTVTNLGGAKASATQTVTVQPLVAGLSSSVVPAAGAAQAPVQAIPTKKPAHHKPTVRQRRARALKRCRKLKAKKAKARCVKAAKAIGRKPKGPRHSSTKARWAKG